MNTRRQRTIARAAEVCGFGLFHGVDCRLIFQPAPVGHGIKFRRTDLNGSPVAATTEFLSSVPRRTAITDGFSTIETIEHAMAALAGLWIDNCLVELDAPEPPIGDGSAMHFVEPLLAAGIVEQSLPVDVAAVRESHSVAGDGGQRITATPGDRLVVGYALDYGNQMAIRPQTAAVTVTPESFVNEIAFARTFVLASEIEGLQKMGFGRRATTQNLLVFDEHGVRENALRRPDECARHKILDAIGDLALCGGRLIGQFHCTKSGHHLNHLMASRLHGIAAASEHPLRRAA